MPQIISPTDITATINPPADQHGGDWNWVDEAWSAWGLAARKAGLHPSTISFVVDDPNHDAAIVEVDGYGEEYVVTVRGREVSAVLRPSGARS